MIIPFLSQKRRASHLLVGQKGERVARDYLRSKGLKVHSSNVRVSRDEMDIIAWDAREKVLVFCEVKTRARADADYRPELNMTPQKLRNVRRAAKRWMTRRGYEGSWRVDAVYVVENTVVDHFTIDD